MAFNDGLSGEQGANGPHAGIGKLALADWWPTKVFELDEDTDAAAKPATTTQTAKARMMSFMIGNPFWFVIGRITYLSRRKS
jgi:hypothetical protein